MRTILTALAIELFAFAFIPVAAVIGIGYIILQLV
jgi:hypothetical protein